MQNSVAINIRKLRKLNKLSLDAFAKKLELSPSNLSRIERGELNINVQLLQKISDCFGVSIQFFFSDQSSVETLKNNHNNFVKQFREASKYINGGKHYSYNSKYFRSIMSKWTCCQNSSNNNHA